MSDLNSCAKADCTVSATGACVEGHAPPESCPFYGKPRAEEPDGDEPEAEDSDTVTEAPSKTVKLPSSEALTVNDVDEFLLQRPMTLIAIVGDRDSGKTTLVCALYEKYLRGQFAGYLFTEGRTLVALEKKTYYSRVESGGSEADTERTKVSDGLHFLHLGLVSEAPEERRVDLMLSDRAGETYRRARSGAEPLSELIEVAKANRVVFLLDGGRLVNPTERAGAFQSVRQGIRAFTDGGLLTTASEVQVVITKSDLLQRATDVAVIEERIGQFQTGLATDLEPRLKKLTFWRIAARDPSGQVEQGQGVDELVREWTTLRVSETAPARIPATLTSELENLLVRTPIKELP